jgi:predicted secreted protein
MRVAAVLIVILGLTLSACSSPASPGPSLTVDCAAFETEGVNGAPVQREIEAGVNQTVKVTLCANPSTGFSWEDPVGEGDAVVELVEHGINQTIGGPPGTAGDEVFTLRTVSAGEAVIHFTYSQPWVGGEKGAWRLDLVMTVNP